MPITYAGRQFEITPSIKRQAEAAYGKIQTVLGGGYRLGLTRDD